jgi:hypothetical protein
MSAERTKFLKTALANPPERDYAPRSFFGNLAAVTVVASWRVRTDFILWQLKFA